MDPKWLQWAKQLQAIAQTGLTYTQDPFDTERYQALRHIAVEIMAAHTDADIRHIADLFADEVGHATPKIDLRGVVFQDDEILLVRERMDGGLWTIPGGWGDIDESPAEGVVREVYEESGYRTRAVKLLALWDCNKHGHPPHRSHIYKLMFHCEITGGAPKTSLETSEVAFFAENEIADLPLSLSRNTPAQIARLFEHYRHLDWPTDFD